jgi:DNA polymerase-3 subunit gamma/tau
VPDRPALYRRYRPQTFAQVVGQEHVTRTLRNAIAGGDVAHAYLLAGARGTGKTSIARLIAKALNCPRAADGEPCDRCENCTAIREGRFLDLIEIDAASNRGIDEMRDLREKVRFAPAQGAHKVYVIDEAHQLTPEAFNALLKTLEEPPPHVVFVLATTEPQRIPPTIVSRTQRFDLRRIPHRASVDQLARIADAEGLKVDRAALEAIARHAQGSLRDAESILDQVVTFAGDERAAIRQEDVDELLGSSDWDETAALFDALLAGDGPRAVGLVGALLDDGRDLRLFVRRAIDHARALVLVQATGRADPVSESVAAKLNEQAPQFTLERLALIAKRLIEAEQQLRTSEGTPLPLELAILDLVTPAAPEPLAGPREQAAPRTREGATRGRRVGDGGRRVGDGAREAPTGESGTGATEASATDRAGTELAGQEAPAAAIVELSVHREQLQVGASGALAIDRVRLAWGELVERTKERSVGKAAQLVRAEPLGVEGATVVIGFTDEFARSVWQDRRRAELERDLSVLLEREVRVRCIRSQPRDGAQVEDPMLRAALETFRTPERILEIE